MFSAFERMVAFRYLRARRREGFISIIAWFSLLGIALGVATLIIVMSVMNGFRAELMGRILGLNGHMVVQSYTGGLPGYNTAAYFFPAEKITVIAWVTLQSDKPEPGVANAIFSDIATIMTPQNKPFVLTTPKAASASTAVAETISGLHEECERLRVERWLLPYQGRRRLG